MKEFTLEAPHEFIQLNQLLKLLNLVETGGEANQCITEGRVKVNGTIELQKRKKLRPGDRIDFEEQTILIKAEAQL
ncbi:MAG: RNA-binding S4 domain-containing protein [Bacteroidales bacterium]|nr:RNA-binding S4 domain-containing protein [Bacteroidales bacterium]